MAKKKDKKTTAARIENRKARYNYHILETLEVGIVLGGSEVKSARGGQVSLGEGFARVDPASMELFLHGVHISPYAHAGPNGHQPDQTRKLLAHKREINRLYDLTSGKGPTLVPLAMYFVRGRAKLLLGVGVGKKQYDKRQDMKKRDAQKDIRRAMTRKRL